MESMYLYFMYMCTSTKNLYGREWLCSTKLNQCWQSYDGNKVRRVKAGIL